MTIHSIDSSKPRNKVLLEIELGKRVSGIYDLTNLSISVALGTDSLGIMDLNDYLIFFIQCIDARPCVFTKKNLNYSP